jgi:type 1 glutamine amidotransferase
MKKAFVLLFLISYIVILSSTVTAQSSQNNLKGKNVLFVYGGWEGHEPVQTRDIFVPWLLLKGSNVKLSNSLDVYTDTAVMNNIDLIIQVWTMGEITNEQEKGLITAVKNGVGLAGWHGGLGDSFRNSVEFQYMVGGQWVAHPGGIINYEVNITNHDDVVTKGLNDFEIESEQYYMHVDPNVKVLATTTFNGDHDYWIDGAVVPVVWKKMFGKGRVFYSSLGHAAKDFEIHEVIEIMKRGINWTVEKQ